MSARLAFQADHAAAVEPVPIARSGWPQPSEARPQWDDALSRIGLVSTVAHDCGIYAEGDEARTFFKVVVGVVRTCKFLDDGSRQIDAFYVAGDVFGIGNGPHYRFSAEAVTDCSLMTYRRLSLERLLANDNALAEQLFTYAMRGMERAQDHALLLGRRCALEKVLAFLLDWARHTPDTRTIALSMSRRDVADYLGLTIESVSRALSQLQRDAVIELPSARKIRFKALPCRST